MRAINSKNMMKQLINISMLLFLLSTASLYAGEITGDGEGASVNTIPSSMLSYEVLQSAPAKFDRNTLLTYSIPKPMDVVIKIYDNAGMEMATLVNEEQNAGTHNLILTSANLKDGVYFYMLTIGSYQEIKKIMLVN